MHAGGIDGDRLLGEDVLARLDRRAEVDRAEMRRRAEQYHVHAAAEQLPVSVESDEAMIGLDGDFGRDLLGLLQDLQTVLQPVFEGVGHGDELDVRIGGERLGGRTGAAVAAADQADPEHVAAGRVNVR